MKRQRDSGVDEFARELDALLISTLLSDVFLGEEPADSRDLVEVFA